VFTDLLRPGQFAWTPDQLRALTSTVATEFTDQLRTVLRYEQPQRWWTRLGLTEGVELWLLSWLPGQGTGPHDHGGAAGAFSVLHGELAEHYRYPASPIRFARHGDHTAVGFGAGRAHDLRNAGPVPAASVHAYSPPLVATRRYATLLDVPNDIPTLIPEPR
jgi:predicted metal-dependent enzyme (double-stranded beta helix superfamily)